MIRNGNVRQFLRMTIALILVTAASSAAAKHPSETSPAPTQGEASSGTVAYLHSLIDSHQLTLLRTASNDSYGASLFFQTDKLSYFVALFHGDMFWRVIQTDSERNAETIYHAFVQQSEHLAEVDIDAVRLQAGNAYAEHLMAINQQRLQNLQQDASRQQQQAQQVAAQQQQSQQQAVALSNDLRSNSSQLDAVKQQIQTLEAQQANPELILPPPPQPAAASSTPPPASPKN
jgi:hypothetical protein